MAKKNKFFGFLTGALLYFLGKNPEFSEKNLKSADFPSSTQRMGIGFNERVRGIFRFKWLKKRQ